jgi:ABC-type dipeptide/oligopeptide/nickel transport system permease component
VDYHTNTWCGPRFHKDVKTSGKSDVRALLTNVEEDLYLDHEGNLVTVDDDFSQTEMIHGLAQQAVQQVLKTEVQKLDEELGNDYKTKQQVYRVIIARINLEEHEDEEGY